MTALKAACDAILDAATSGTDASARVPGVIAMIGDRSGLLYEGAAGERGLGTGVPMTTDTVLCLFSCTKAVTATVVMQLVEEGLIDLDAPASTYIPDLGELQVIEGFADDGSPRLRAPKRDLTTRMLLLHTGGFGYEIFSEAYLRLVAERGHPSVLTATRAALRLPLLFDPGERWEYGACIDWAGQVAEAVTGHRLGDLMSERLFGPTGMTDTGFFITAGMRERRATIHQRGPDGSLTPLPELELPQDPEVQMGGHGLYGTVGDYMKFIRMFLNDGAGDHGRVLKPETVRQMEANGLGALKVRPLKSAIATLSNDAEFFPGMPKSWGLSFMINEEPAPTGRPAGALSWAGLGNLYFWIDRANGIGGFWATQILPFADAVSFGRYLELETATYRALKARKAA